MAENTNFYFYGLLLLYWFQFPIILLSIGKFVALTDFNFLFAITLPTTFLGLVFIYSGLLWIISQSEYKISRKYLMFWVIASFVVFGIYFQAGSQIINFNFAHIGIFLFYTPIYSLILYTLVKWLFTKDKAKTKKTYSGIFLLILAMILGIIRNLITWDKIKNFPPEFWFNVFSTLSILHILQITGAFLLIAGLITLHHAFHETSDKEILLLRKK